MNDAHELALRILQSDDAEQYVNLRLEALKENPEAFASTYEETASENNLLQTWRNRLSPTPDVFTMGAFRGATLISVATLVRDSRTKVRHKGSLVAIYTTPAERGRGVAKKLLTKMIEQAREIDDLEQINLTVISENTAACRLYHSLGFVTFGTETNGLKYKETYWDEDYMSLKL